ncbi:hypothetical protein B0G84_8666 [Paraburkholderia sp. BL8N3]|nr:hypothetical protein [Paraburkholderia sp. BL8N3]TCK32784.1 hypothetical protein B0G84_8666 [Paraburkholderia sp. BL8N3]
MLADSLLELLLGLPEGAALLLPIEFNRATIEVAVDHAAKADPSKWFKVGEHRSRATTHEHVVRYLGIEQVSDHES